MSFDVVEKGLTLYQDCYQQMLNFNKNRLPNSNNEIWFTEHKAIFTQGRAGKDEHILQESNIPIYKTDRGGQVTYHGPGQLITYTMFNLKSINMGIKNFVYNLEQSIIDTLTFYQIKAHRIESAPGVYVNNAKIAALGLRVSKGLTMHGMSFNIDMDLSPFNYINPCGYQDLKVTMLKEYVPDINIKIIKELIALNLQKSLTN